MSLYPYTSYNAYPKTHANVNDLKKGMSPTPPYGVASNPLSVSFAHAYPPYFPSSSPSFSNQSATSQPPFRTSFGLHPKMAQSHLLGSRSRGVTMRGNGSTCKNILKITRTQRGFIIRQLLKEVGIMMRRGMQCFWTISVSGKTSMLRVGT